MINWVFVSENNNSLFKKSGDSSKWHTSAMREIFVNLLVNSSNIFSRVLILL